ncbi:MAG: copper amine oxidase [bacterium]|nr:copper amine oxidase [Candidatus Sumerlaeota bacterium]
MTANRLLPVVSVIWLITFGCFGLSRTADGGAQRESSTPSAVGLESQTAKTAPALTLETDVERILRKAESAKAVTTVPIEVNDKLVEAHQGSTVPMGDFDMEALPILPFMQTAGGPPFLFADDPEYIRLPEAAVLRERVNPGPVRLYLYHCNGTTNTIRKISAVIQNLSAEPMKFRFLRYSFPGVGHDYGQLGRMGAKMFFSSLPQPAPRIIPPHAAEPLDDAVEKSQVSFNQLIHAWYEFETDQPARITIVQTDPVTSSPVAAARIRDLLPPRSRSGAGRGYYPYSEYEIHNPPGMVYDTSMGAYQIMIADGKLDRWLTGHDSSSTAPSILKGNYGVLYRIKIHRTSSDGRALALLIWNARTKSGCKAMSGCAQVDAGKFPAGTVLVPSDAQMLRGGNVASVLQVYPPLAHGCTETFEIVYTPPGASCLPTPLLLVPFEMPK